MRKMENIVSFSMTLNAITNTNWLSVYFRNLLQVCSSFKRGRIQDWHTTFQEHFRWTAKKFLREYGYLILTSQTLISSHLMSKISWLSSLKMVLFITVQGNISYISPPPRLFYMSSSQSFVKTYVQYCARF